MILGPHALLGNNPRSIEYNVEWITDLIKYRGEKVVPRKGLEPPLSYEKRILSHPKVHSPSDNVRLVNSFISDRKLRGLSPNTIKFYEGYLNQFVNTTLVPYWNRINKGLLTS